MDLQKIGTFLRDCRKEKGLTQEQLAETLNISRRTVSRWETGSNMPDLDLLTEMADLYRVDLRELLNGERKNVPMNEEMKETVLQVAEYSSGEKQRDARSVRTYFALGILALIANAALDLVIGLIIWSAVSFVIVGVGVWTWRSEKAAGFYSGTEPPEVTDIRGYNHATAILWFAYAAAFELLGVLQLFIRGKAAGILVLVLGTVAVTVALPVVYTRILRRFERKP